MTVQAPCEGTAAGLTDLPCPALLTHNEAPTETDHFCSAHQEHGMYEGAQSHR